MEFSNEIILLLFIASLIAGWVDTIAGGGGLITIPALLLSGMPAEIAIATNKLQGSAGTAFSSWHFIKKKIVSIQKIKKIIFMTFIGSIFGSWFLLNINSEILSSFLPYILIAIGLYFLISPSINNEENKRKKQLGLFTFVIAPFLGFYDGFFGPGTGSLMALSCILFYGKNISSATAHAKILNFTSNFSALLYFIFFGHILWSIGLVMMMGQTIGAFLGAKTVLKSGNKIIRPVIVLVCFLIAIKLILNN